MPTPTATPTRERIIEAAIRLFSERGTTATSVRDVADAAGVTVPGLYYHFASKADLIQAALQARSEGIAPEQIADDDLPPDLESRIRVRAQREFERLVADASFLRLMQREGALGDDDAKQVGDQLREAWRVRWCDVLAGAADRSPRVDVDAAADCVVTFLWGVFVEYLGQADGDRHALARISAFAGLIAPGLRS